MRALVSKLADAIRAASVLVAIVTCTLVLWLVIGMLRLDGGLDEGLRFLSVPFVAWMVIALAARPSGSVVLRGILAFGLISGLLAGMNSQVDVKDACSTGWVGDECEDFMRGRNAIIPVVTVAWAVTCSVLLVGLWKNSHAPNQSAA